MISLFQSYLSFLYPQRLAPHHIGCILPHPPHCQLRQLVVFKEQRCVHSYLLNQVCKTLVQQLQRESKIYLCDPHFSGQRLWTHNQHLVGASPIDISIYGFVKIFHNSLPIFLQCTHNKYFVPRAIFYIYSDTTILALTPTMWFL
jgi:hypothetical protein